MSPRLGFLECFDRLQGSGYGVGVESFPSAETPCGALHAWPVQMTNDSEFAEGTLQKKLVPLDSRTV